tara:strand:+ start:3132 stop:3977 length:846 start_codon:yes stop_codon:yes gene_type:complete
MIDIIRHKQVSLNDLQEGEYVINEFGGKIKGVLKLNGKLHNTIFNEESNKASLKSEQNDIVINDGVNDRVIIGDIGKTKDGKLYGMKVSKVGSDARFASENKLLINTAKNFLWPAFRVHIDDSQVWATGGYSKVEFENKNKSTVVNNYDNNSNVDYTNDYFIVPYDGIYHFNTSLLYEDAHSAQVDSGESLSQILYVDSNSSGAYVSSDDLSIKIRLDVYHADLIADKYWSTRLSAETKLSAGDKVQWAINNATGANIEPYNSSTHDVNYNMFTGHLVCLT